MLQWHIPLQWTRDRCHIKNASAAFYAVKYTGWKRRRTLCARKNRLTLQLAVLERSIAASGQSIKGLLKLKIDLLFRFLQRVVLWSQVSYDLFILAGTSWSWLKSKSWFDCWNVFEEECSSMSSRQSWNNQRKKLHNHCIYSQVHSCVGTFCHVKTEETLFYPAGTLPCNLWMSSSFSATIFSSSRLGSTSMVVATFSSCCKFSINWSFCFIALTSAESLPSTSWSFSSACCLHLSSDSISSWSDERRASDFSRSPEKSSPCVNASTVTWKPKPHCLRLFACRKTHTDSLTFQTLNYFFFTSRGVGHLGLLRHQVLFHSSELFRLQPQLRHRIVLLPQSCTFFWQSVAHFFEFVVSF